MVYIYLMEKWSSRKIFKATPQDEVQVWRRKINHVSWSYHGTGQRKQYSNNKNSVSATKKLSFIWFNVKSHSHQIFIIDFDYNSSNQDSTHIQPTVWQAMYYSVRKPRGIKSSSCYPITHFPIVSSVLKSMFHYFFLKNNTSWIWCHR